MTFRQEFSDYPVEDMPAIPEGFVDQSWHNDTCPSFVNEALGVQLFVDYLDPEQRELKWPRFSLLRLSDDSSDDATLASTDDWDEIVRVIDALRPKSSSDEQATK